MKILAITHDGTDAHSFWRFMGPLRAMEKTSPIQVKMMTLGTDPGFWPDVIGVDLVYLHRACTKDDLTMIQLARLFGVPVWVDFDDWLFDVPAWNPNRNFYANPGTMNIMAHCLACADIVTVTTAELYNRVRKINENTVIVPNAYRDDLFTYREESIAPRNQIAVWRGTNTHDGDLASVQQGFSSLRAKVHFLGSPSWSVLGSMPKDSYATLTTSDFMRYFRHIYKMRPKVFVFPLDDCLFNRCKSNIAWIEALHAGAICVAPDMPEWRRPGCVNYVPNDSQSFADAVNAVLDMDEVTHLEQVKLAFDHMRDLYSLHTINEIRFALTESIASKSYKPNNRDPEDQLVGLWALGQLTQVPMVNG